MVLGTPASGYSFNPSGQLVRVAAQIIVKERPVYSFGAHQPVLGRYDCSSFIKETALRAKLAPLPRDSRSQFELLKKTGKVWLKNDPGWQDLRPGDLIFFSGTYRHSHANPISHVMIYAGENQMIGAQSSGVGLFDFTPVSPKGSPESDCRSIYRKSTVYAYARPNWRQIQQASTSKGKPSSLEPRSSSYQTVSGASQYRSYARGEDLSRAHRPPPSAHSSGWLPSR